jgi:5-dehydro-2-deoxygluconokinase
MHSEGFDLITMGRSSIDLYSNDIGAPFPEITSFAAYVGGCPTNVAVGARRLGLRTALITAVGQDVVGDFILRFLEGEGVATSSIPRKAERRSSAAVLGIQPPDTFPLLFYRDNAADVWLTIDDVLAAPIAQSRMLLITGTGLSRDPGRSATMFAAELARRSGVPVALDIDFRPDQWHDPRAFGVAIRAVLPLIDIVIGTEDEINAALLRDVGQMQLTHSQVSDTRVAGDVDAAIATLLGYGPGVLLQKRGAEGARVHVRQADGSVERIDAAGYPVEIANILGAGDAFAAGALYGHLRGWGWHKAARLGTACGAIVVTKHGCANFTPTLDEVLAFVATRGGLE